MFQIRIRTITNDTEGNFELATLLHGNGTVHADKLTQNYQYQDLLFL